MGDGIAPLLERALQLDCSGQVAAATRAYLELLRHDPTHFTALNELGRLAQDSGHLSAARTAYEQAVHLHPTNPIGRVNLGNLLYEAGEFCAARDHYEAALAAVPGLADAHQGLSRVLAQLNEHEAAEEHRRKGFGGRPVTTRRYRGTAAPISVLILVSTRGGNLPTRRLLDNRIFALTALYPEFYDVQGTLPSHDLVFNAIGDADLCEAALEHAEALLRRTGAPVINAPGRVRLTGRAGNAARLAGLPGVVVPQIRAVTRAALLGSDSLDGGLDGLTYPLLLRSPGFHTGRHFVRVECQTQLAPAVMALPGDTLLAIEYLNARGIDGMARKYRVMYINGVLYPLHLAISTEWKVHYFSSDMSASEACRAEERRFLEDMQVVLGARAVAALTDIGRRLGLDYAGMDFALGHDDAVLLFEANATMVMNAPEPDPMWDYRRPAVARALDAVTQMLRARSVARP